MTNSSVSLCLRDTWEHLTAKLHGSWHLVNQKEGNGKYPQRFALSEQVCD